MPGLQAANPKGLEQAEHVTQDNPLCDEAMCEPETICVGDDCCDYEECDTVTACDDDHDDRGGSVANDDKAGCHCKISTCCDSVERCGEKCIYNAAALECAKACDGGDKEQKEHQHKHNAAGNHSEYACNFHLQRAWDEYRDYLEQARCICRTLVNQGISSSYTCCKTPAVDEAYATFSSGTSISKPFQLSTPHHHHRRGSHHHHRDNAGSSSAVRRRATKKPSSIAVESDRMATMHTHGHGPCCKSDHGSKPLVPGDPDDRPSTAKTLVNFDMEKAAGHELVSIAVTGMDCTSCGDKLTRLLLMTEGVSQARVNFIAGQAEFTINTSVTNAEEVIGHAASASGFRLTRMVGGSYFLDVSTVSEHRKQLAQHPPNGVTDVHILDKKTVRLSYDPFQVGARTLHDSISDKIQGLAPPRSDPQLAHAQKRLWDQAIKTALAAAFTIPVLVLSWSGHLTDEATKAIVCVVLATAVQGIAIPEFYRPALSTLIYSRVVEMDMLVVISITAAYLYSIIAFGFHMAGRPLETSEFFETSTLLITLILMGRWVATLARVSEMAAVSVRSLQPNVALLVENGKDREIDARLLQYGDQFKLLSHSRVPTDGVIIDGLTEIDESMITGEALPVFKRPGDSVVAGTVNGDGRVLVQLERLPGKNTVTDIAQLVDDAANSKPRIQNLANKVAGWFVPVVSATSIIVLVVWIILGLKSMKYSGGRAALGAITYFVATLAVACPCALGLAVPMVLVVAGGLAAKKGVIIKSAETTESARKATDIIFDKTGTITESDLVVVAERYFSDKQSVVSLTKSLVTNGKHPVSVAVARHLGQGSEEADSSSDVLTNIHILPGLGIEASFEDSTFRAGNPRWTNTDSHPTVAEFHQDGLTTLVVTQDEILLAIFGLRSRVRKEAPEIVRELKGRGIKVHLVSGDQSVAVKSVARAVGIPEENVAAECTPSQKRDYVASLMEDSSRYVVFCGDGTNDAVAVAQANVGLHIGGGLATSEVTQTAADGILLKGLEGIPLLLDVSKAAFHRMVFNFVWSAIYNVLAITMASGAWVKFRIPPAYAGLGELVSVLPVILASMTMLLTKVGKPVPSTV